MKVTGLTLTLAATLLLTSTTAMAGKYEHRPANATGDAPPIDARVHIIEQGPAPSGFAEETVGYWEVYYDQPTTIDVSIYTLDSIGREVSYQQTVTVDFTTYVKDVLPNEWTEDWGKTSAGMNSLYAGALAVKTFGWYHVIAWKKDELHNAHVTNGITSQVYKAGSNKPNCNNAVNYVRDMVIVNSGDEIFETGYRDDVSTPGTLMSQHGTYNDAMNGMWFGDIIKKWYSSYGGKHTATRVYIY